MSTGTIYNGSVARFARGRDLLARVDRWLAGVLADAIEADLRDAGFEVLGRTETGAVVWADPVHVESPA
jgi:hypothetical protein